MDQKTMAKVKPEEVRRFMIDCLTAVGADKQAAAEHADLLVHADLVGHFSHGLNRLEIYINDVQTGATDLSVTPEILREAGATAWVDGKNGLGAVVSKFCMEVAIKKAKEVGVGLVSAKGCNHFGMAGYWALQAEREGLIGMAFTNSSPIMVPTRSKQRAMGTNPISMAAGAPDGDGLLVDLATTTVAMGKIEMQVHKGEPLPYGWALGPDGQVTRDAKIAFDQGWLLPLGGVEETSGYKGYALSAFVEVLCSGLSASNPAYKVRGWAFDTQEGAPDLGQCYIAINPDFFAPGFGGRIRDMLNWWRGLEPVDPSLPVLAPGDKERINAEETKKKGYISYPPNQIESYNKIAKKLGVQCLQLMN